MSFKTFISPIALAAALTISTGALAQTMLGDQAVSDEELPAVSDHCQTLASEGEDSTGTDATSADDDSEDAAADDETAAADAPGDTPATDGMATDPEIATSGDTMAGDANIDLEAITLAECAEAGLI